MVEEIPEEELPKLEDIPKAPANEFVKGFALSGDYIKTLSDKSFEIVGQRIDILPVIDHPDEKEEKNILSVKLSNGTIIDYIPNKTSMKSIIMKRGYKLSDWIGLKGRFYTTPQQVGAFKREVIYIE